MRSAPLRCCPETGVNLYAYNELALAGTEALSVRTLAGNQRGETMLSKAVILLSTASFFASASAAGAQIYNGPPIPSRFSIGGDFAISQPKGEFATAGIPTGYGFDVVGLLRIDPTGWFALRADGGGVQYGHEGGFIGYYCGIPLDLTTDHRIGFGSLGVPVG